MKKAKVNANNLGSIFPSFLSSLSQVDFSRALPQGLIAWWLDHHNIGIS